MGANLSNTQTVLRDAVQRFERLDEEKSQLTKDQQVIMAELKAAGFDTKAVRRVLALRKMDAAGREEHESLVTLYRRALGEEEFT